MSKPQLQWTVVETYDQDGTVISLLHQTQTTARDPWSVKVKLATGQAESDDFPSEEGARAIYNQILATLGVDTTPQILEPEHPEQLLATWWTRLHHTKQQMPAQEEVEIAFAADPRVRQHAAELMLMAEGKKGWVYGIMRACLRPILLEEKQKELAMVRSHQNFGRFA